MAIDDMIALRFRITMIHRGIAARMRAFVILKFVVGHFFPTGKARDLVP